MSWRARTRVGGQRRGTRGTGGERDEGTALLFAMVFVIIGSFMVLPLLDYATAVLKAGGVQTRKADRAEALRGVLRMALSDPGGLYRVCSDAGLHLELDLAVPSESEFGVPMKMSCTTVRETTEADSSELRVAMTTTSVGSVAPAGTTGDPYVNSGNIDPALWKADTTTESTGGKIYLPYLPVHGLNHPAAAGYMMPSYAGNCRVFFPGSYDDPITITDSIPTFFTSGIYYFEDVVTFGANANVVIGEGAIEGCATNAEAAFDAINAPQTATISGIGATFVFGGAGRMVVTDGGQPQGPNVLFNARLADPTDVGSSVSHGVSIISVNGVAVTSTVSGDLLVPGFLDVGKSLTETNPDDGVAPTDAAASRYVPSTLVPQPSPAPEVTPILSVSFTGSGPSTLFIPGYVAVPQGRVDISVAPTAGVNKSVQLLGAVLAAKVTTTSDIPDDLQLGMVNRIVQKTFKLVAETTVGLPYVQSVAIVQINDYGEYAINTWVTAGI